MTADATTADLLLDALARLERAETEIARLRTLMEPEPAAAPGPAGSTSDPSVDRRRFLGRAAVAAAGGAVATAAATVGAASPAAAADGNSIVIGAVNGGSTRTVLLVPGTAEYGFGVHEGDVTEFPYDAAIAGAATTAFSTGVVGYSPGDKTGVGAYSFGGTAMLAYSPTGTALSAATSSGQAVHANSTGGAAVYAVGAGSDTDGAGAIVSVSAAVPAVTTIGRRSLHLIPKAEGGNPAPPSLNRVSRAGELAVEAPEGNADSALWYCTDAGTPGVWRKVAGPDTAGAFHVLPATKRIYDSRPGDPPAGVTKGKLEDGANRAIDAKVAGAVPAGATAVLVNLTIVDTSAAGFLALHKNGIAWPGNSSINWGSPGTVLANSAVVALDDNARFRAQCSAGSSTHFLIDVIGFYR